MGKCVVCPSRTGEKLKCSFHRFPKKNPLLRKKWVNWVSTVKKLNWTPSVASRVCSDHFLESCFVESANRVQLIPHSIPTIFEGATIPANPSSMEDESSSSHISSSLPDQQPSIELAIQDTTPEKSINISEVRCSIDAQRALVFHDHKYEDTPRTKQKKMLKMRENLRKVRITSKIQKQRISRMKKKVTSLKEIVSTLKNQRLISENGAHCMDNLSDAPVELFKRMKKNNDAKKLTRQKYSPQLRSFALTLHFYSPKAYSYVRKTFDLALPHPSVLRTWYCSLNCEPGFISESFETLENKCRVQKAADRDVICALMLDEIGIKKGTQRGRDGIQRGHVDIGSGLPPGDCIPEAKEALVFMVVGVDASWKLPLAYFLIDGMTSETLANLVSQTLIRLQTIGARVTSLTLDGPPSHMAVTRILGADMSMPNPRPYFPHPSNPSELVFVVLDACHMLKLIRNCLGDYKVLLDGEGRRIEWRFIVELARLQEDEGLRAGNKLRSSHILFHKNIMKVRLAAQTLSSSVADAIEFCDLKLDMPKFKGSEATVQFLRSIDSTFDFLNVRSPLGRGLKSPLRVANEPVWRSRMETNQQYILQLTTLDSKPIYNSRRSTGFIGFYTAITAVFGIFDKFVNCEGSQMKYFLPYKISQDHSELFFCAIRQRSGWCPNPTASQFVSAFKRLLVRHEISSTNGNVDALDQTKILHVSPNTNKKNARLDTYDTNVYTEVENNRVFQKYELDCQETLLADELQEFLQFSEIMPDNLSEFSEHTVGYIAGFVIRKIQKSLKCTECITACFGEILDEDQNRLHRLSLTITKTHGGLIMPSQSVLKVCLATEKLFRRACNKNMGRPPIERNFPAVLSNSVFRHVTEASDLFPELWEHKLDTFSENLTNHVDILIKAIIKVYTELRMYSQTKNHSIRLTGINMRHFLTRQIVWSNQ